MSTVQINIRKANEELAQGRLDRAADYFEKVLYQERQNEEALVGIARIALATDSYREAQKATEEALSVNPKNTDAIVFRALAIEAQGDSTTALADVKKSADAHPKHFLSQFHAGRLLADSGQFSKATGYLNKAEKLGGAQYDVYNLLGAIYQEQGKYKSAVLAFRKAMKLDPHRMEAYFSLVDVLTAGSEFKDALDILEHAKKSFGRHPAILQKHAGLLMFQGDVKGAMAITQELIEEVPDNVQIWLNFGMLHAMNQDLEAAENAILRAQEVDPKHWEPHFQLGTIYSAAGLEDKAEACYRASIEVGSGEWEPVNNLGLLLLGTDDPKKHAEAEELFQIASDLAPQLDRFLPAYNLALAFAKQGKKADAIEFCKALLQQNISPQEKEQVQRLLQEVSG